MSIKEISPLKCILIPVVVTLSLMLSACGGGGSANSPPAQPGPPGQLNSTIQFNFNSSLPEPANLQTQLIEGGINGGLGSSRAATSNLENLVTYLGFNAGNLAIHATSLGVNRVNAYAITYATSGVNSGDPARNVSGLVLVPVQANGKIINNPKGIVVFYHPTELAKNSAPSCLTPAIVTNSPTYCNFNPNVPNTYAGVTGDSYYIQLSSVYAAAGYIVIAPDYIGQGIDNQVIHPYVLYPAANADAGLYMIGAARDMLNSQNILSKSIPLNLFLTGVSEGGAYALSASEQAQNKLQSFLANTNVTLKMTAPAEGAYDPVAQMQFEFADLMDGAIYCGFTNGTPIPCNPPATLTLNIQKILSTQIAAGIKPLLASLTLTTLATYGHESYTFVMSSQFFNIPLAGTTSLANLSQLLSSPIYSSSQISNSIAANSINLINPDNQLPYGGGGPSGPNYETGMNNSIRAFTDPAILQDPNIAAILNNAITYLWTTTSPIDFIHLNYDSVVAMANYENAYSSMLQSTPTLISQTTIPNDSIYNQDCLSTTTNSSIFCQANPFVPSGGPIPLTHGAMTSFVEIGALCAFEHAKGFNNICT